MFGKSMPKILLLLAVSTASQAFAFPWDTDLNKQQSLKANEIGRAPAKGSIAIGAESFDMTLDDAEKKLSNPVPFSFDSVWRGRRLYTVQCATCHGQLAAGDGPVGPLMSVPNLNQDIYKNRGDGRIYAVIQLGGASMPRYGYKLSIDDKWDLVNYVRFLQGRDVSGMKRAEVSGK